MNEDVKNCYSQFNEEEILNKIFSLIGAGNKTFIELGALPDYKFSNTRMLEEHGWTGKRFDKNGGDGIIEKFITAENINEIVDDVDLLSIDIDGNDYWVWKAIKIKPRVVVIEFNPTKIGITPYDPNFVWKNNNNYGVSKEELIKLGKEKGYVKVAETKENLFFIC